VHRQFETADNMTEVQAALGILSEIDCEERVTAFEAFYAKWKHDPLVTDKWFSVQAASSLPSAVDHVIALSSHPDFTWKNPNRVRSLVNVFGIANQVRFHSADGRGYVFLADAILRLDDLNPQVASRVASCFNQWQRFDADRQSKMKTELERIAAKDGLSKDVHEIVSRSLA